MRKLAIALAASVALAGCSTLPTPFRELSTTEKVIAVGVAVVVGGYIATHRHHGTPKTIPVCAPHCPVM